MWRKIENLIAISFRHSKSLKFWYRSFKVSRSMRRVLQVWTKWYVGNIIIAYFITWMFTPGVSEFCNLCLSFVLEASQNALILQLNWWETHRWKGLGSVLFKDRFSCGQFLHCAILQAAQHRGNYLVIIHLFPSTYF